VPKPKTTEEAFKDLDDRLLRLGQDIGNIKRYLGMAELSYKNGDHIVAKRHLKRALDLEFAIGFDCEAGGTLAELWYPGEEI
jgi:hypothetical protein